MNISHKNLDSTRDLICKPYAVSSKGLITIPNNEGTETPH